MRDHPGFGSGRSGGLERVCPPDEVVEHQLGGVGEVGEIGEVFFVFHQGQQFVGVDVNGEFEAGDLQFCQDQPELFDGAGAADPAIAEEGGRLADIFGIGVVEGVLEDGGDGVGGEGEEGFAVGGAAVVDF